MSDRSGEPFTFPTEYQDRALGEPYVIDSTRRFRADEEGLSQIRELLFEGSPVRPNLWFDAWPIVEPGPPNLFFLQGKTERLDQMELRTRG